MSEDVKSKETQEDQGEFVEQEVADEAVENTEGTEEVKAEENLSDLEKAEIEIRTLKADLEEAKASEMRTKAEMMNFRKRAEKERTSWNQLTLKDFAGSLLDPLDNLDRTIEAAQNTEGYEENSALKNLSEGINMVMVQFKDIFEKKNIKCIDPKGETFNPNEHEAYGQIETDEVEEGHVAAVFRKGYKIGDVLIRTATVQIAKKPTVKEEEQS